MRISYADQEEKSEHPTYIIGEPGSTHGGHYEHMLDLVGIAKRAGCNAVKWQWISSADALAARRNAGSYVEHYRAIEFPLKTLDLLLAATRAAGMDALCTVYLPEDMAYVAPRVDKVKIASFEANDPLLLNLAWAFKKPVIVSTGMMTQEETEQVTRYPLDTLLHCVSAYPAPLNQLNLAVIRRWRYGMGRYSCRVGFSDHSAQRHTGALAVAAGAQVLEIHYRHPLTSASNADYATALDPDGLEDYVERVREAEAMLGNGIKSPTPSEAAMQAFRVA